MTICDNCGTSYPKTHQTKRFSFCCGDCRAILYRDWTKRKEISKLIDENNSDKINSTVKNLVRLGFKVKIQYD